jgi:hypothetical protein
MNRGRECRFQGVRVACNGPDRHPDVVAHAADKHALYALITSVIMCSFFNVLLVLGPQFPEQPVPGCLAAIQKVLQTFVLPLLQGGDQLTVLCFIDNFVKTLQ